MSCFHLSPSSQLSRRLGKYVKSILSKFSQCILYFGKKVACRICTRTARGARARKYRPFVLYGSERIPAMARLLVSRLIVSAWWLLPFIEKYLRCTLEDGEQSFKKNAPQKCHFVLLTCAAIRKCVKICDVQFSRLARSLSHSIVIHLPSFHRHPDVCRFLPSLCLGGTLVGLPAKPESTENASHRTFAMFTAMLWWNYEVCTFKLANGCK